jgi:CO/xanthine dehydrogenase Mo-binding subunit
MTDSAAAHGAALSRRELLRRFTVGTVGVIVLPLASFGADTFGLSSPRQDARKGSPRMRIDGRPKVTGSKLYAADFRAADMPGWPVRTSHAMLLRARDVTHVFAGVDLSDLEPSLRPDRTVLAEHVAAANLHVPAFHAGDLLCPVGKAPAYLGQPLALLIWDDFAAFAVARQRLRGAAGLIRRGAAVSQQSRMPYGGMRYVRIAGPTPASDDVYSPVRDGWTVPARYRPIISPEHAPNAPSFVCEWDPPNLFGSASARASYYGQEVRRLLDEPNPDLLVIEQTFHTPPNDPVFLEPENGLAWHDPSRRTLELVVGTQSPDESASSVAELVGQTSGDLRVANVVAHCASPGGGFGGREHSIFPLYVALAGLFAANKPVRLANDRFEQFQSGLKRHAFQVASKLGVDRRTRKFVAYAADLTVEGDKLYGVGVACIGNHYGGSADAALAKVEITPDARILATSSGVEIGTGLSTAVAVRAGDHLGACADRVTMAALTEWKPLRLVTSGNPYTISQADQDAAASNPRWVPRLNAPTYASIGAHVHTHVVAEAAQIVFRFGIWPAALAIWGHGIMGGQAIGQFLRPEDATFIDGALTAAGMEPLSLARLAAKAHEMGLVTTAMVHGFNRWEWAVADFEILGTKWQAPIDAIALQYGAGAGADRQTLMNSDGFHLLNRTSVSFPSTLFQRFLNNYMAACGSIAAVEIERTTGNLNIVEAYSVLECGRALVPEAVVGQAQGGFAQGVGFALTEFLPSLEGGPGNGEWNLDQYRVPRASDLPLWNLEVEILPPLGDADVPKGIGEVVMMPIVPALLNAIHDATGHRFTEVPVTAAAIKEALK